MKTIRLFIRYKYEMQKCKKDLKRRGEKDGVSGTLPTSVFLPIVIPTKISK